MVDNNSKTIWVITDDSQSGRDDIPSSGSREGSSDTGGKLGRNVYAPRFRRREPVSTEKMKQEFEGFLEATEEVFSHLDKRQSMLNLDEVEIEVEVSAEGKFSLLGSGGKIGSKGAIKLKFKL
ncbi:MAG: hypothetical protein AAFQ95_15805 [Cyanobacteria bacterium J06621_3]